MALISLGEPCALGEELASPQIEGDAVRASIEAVEVAFAWVTVNGWADTEQATRTGNEMKDVLAGVGTWTVD